MVNVIINTSEGFTGIIYYLANNTQGWFWIFALIAIFIVALIPMLREWSFDWSFLAASFGTMLISLPIYFAGGLTDKALFVFVLIFTLSLLKVMIFKEE